MAGKKGMRRPAGDCGRCGNHSTNLKLGLCPGCYEYHRRQAKPRAATRLRKNRRYPLSLLTRRQVEAAHVLYQQGWSLRQLARAGWQTWGYASPGTAQSALQLAFTLDGLPMRTNSESMVLYHQGRGCGGCGCDLDDRTTGCTTCCTRHSYRQRRGLPFKAAAAPSETERAA